MKDQIVEWPHNDKVQRGYSQTLVQPYCVQHKEWQKCRLSMKGLPTSQKLAVLLAWWDKHHGKNYAPDGTDICEIQVGNYLGALRRGGQLDDKNHIRKEYG